MKSLVTLVEHRDRSTMIRLSCGHERSIGGHRFHDGSIPYIGMPYDCQDGTCCRPVRS